MRYEKFQRYTERRIQVSFIKSEREQSDGISFELSKVVDLVMQLK